jgi:2-dehydro-3-deoxygluconokinase
MLDLVCFGEPLVGIYPTHSDTPDLCRLVFGGDTSNVALAAARLGLKVGYLTAIGSDAYGERFLRLWQERGVDTSMVSIDPYRSTGLYVLSFGRTSQDHRFGYYRSGSAASAIRFETLPVAKALETRILHLSGISQAISPLMLDASFRLMAAAKERGVTVSYDVNYRNALWGPDAAGAVACRTIHGFADIVSANTEELSILGLPQDSQELLDSVGREIGLLSLRRGSAGAQVCLHGSDATASPYRVDVVDTVGAGDAFDAALILSYLRGWDAQQSVQFAAGVAALTCTGVGPTERHPTESEATIFMESGRLSKT